MPTEFDPLETILVELGHLSIFPFKSLKNRFGALHESRLDNRQI